MKRRQRENKLSGLTVPRHHLKDDVASLGGSEEENELFSSKLQTAILNPPDKVAASKVKALRNGGEKVFRVNLIIYFRLSFDFDRLKRRIHEFRIWINIMANDRLTNK